MDNNEQDTSYSAHDMTGAAAGGFRDGQRDVPDAVDPSAMSRHSRAMLLNVIWHHQGASSTVGQPLRAMLGIGQHDRLSDEQLADAKWIDELLAAGLPVPAEKQGAGNDVYSRLHEIANRDTAVSVTVRADDLRAILAARQPVGQEPTAAGELPEPVGVAGTMPGTGGFTIAAFKAEDVPVGTKLYATAAAAECRRDGHVLVPVQRAEELTRQERDAERYRRLRSSLFTQWLHVGEAEVGMRVYGACPSPDDIDAAVDAMQEAG